MSHFSLGMFSWPSCWMIVPTRDVLRTSVRSTSVWDMLEVHSQPTGTWACTHSALYSRRMERVIDSNASESSSGDLAPSHGLSAFMTGLQTYSGFTSHELFHLQIIRYCLQSSRFGLC